MSKRIVIAGGRDFDDYQGMCKVLDKIKWEPDDVIVSGTANGADTLGERYANEHGLRIARFPARWDKHGKKAGFLRNEEMAEFCTGGILFWDGVSRGTRSMIFLLEKYKKPFKIIRYIKKEEI